MSRSYRVLGMNGYGACRRRGDALEDEDNGLDAWTWSVVFRGGTSGSVEALCGGEDVLGRVKAETLWRAFEEERTDSKRLAVRASEKSSKSAETEVKFDIESADHATFTCNSTHRHDHETDTEACERLEAIVMDMPLMCA